MTTRFFAALTLLLALPACRGEMPDAFGIFEAAEVIVSAEVAGQLQHLEAFEGSEIAAGAVAGWIDSTSAMLQRQELLAGLESSEVRARQAEAQVGIVVAQLATAERELERARRLYASEAATAFQLDQAEGQVRVLQAQVAAARVAAAAVRQERAGVEARLAQVGDRIRRSRIVNPASGTVLVTYAEPGEFVQPGQPLYKVARLDTLTLRVYVSGSRLSALRLSQPVAVHLDAPGGGVSTRGGRISWIASEAEFTPTPIQTREERVAQVYAVKIRVPNPDGTARIGMPADVTFDQSEGGAP